MACLLLGQSAATQPLLLGQGSVRPHFKVSQWRDATMKCLPEMSRVSLKDQNLSLTELFGSMAKVFELRSPTLQYRWVDILDEKGKKKQLRFEAVNQEPSGRWKYALVINTPSQEGSEPGLELEKRIDRANEQLLNKEIGASNIISDERSIVYSNKRSGASFQVKHQRSEVDEIQVYLPQKHLQLFCGKLPSGSLHCRCTPR